MKKNFKKIKKISVILLGIFLLLFVVPKVLPISLEKIPNSSIVYDRNHQEIGEIIYDKVHRHQRLDLKDYPEFLKTSILFLEDQRFYSHNGIDIYAIIRAISSNIQADNRLQGASTISSQIARNQLWLNAPRTWARKIVEFAYAYVLDSRYTKDELLSYYLNTIPLGYMNYGFETAARRYFGKSIFQLSKEQQIALLTLVKNAVRYDPFKNPQSFAERYEMIGKILLSWEELKDFSFASSSLERRDHQEYSQPYVRDFIQQTIKSGSQPQEIITTIDSNISRDIKQIADQTIYKLQWKNISDYGVLILDKKTNELIVMLWGMYYDGKAGQVNATLSINQPWSAVKPFTYALAFKELGLTPDDTIVDEPVQYQSLLGFSYTPQNFSMDYKGEVSLASALAQSLNIPAVKLVHQIGVDKVLDFYHKVGLSSLKKSADYYGLAITLGVGEISLRELTQAYGIFVHKGELCSIVSKAGETTICKQIIDSKYTDMVVDVLSNRFNKMPTFPMYSNLDFPDRNVFLKSGTSRKFSDNRVVGFTDDYIIGVWAGNKDGSNMKGVSGVSGAGDIFNNIVYYLEKDFQTPSAIPRSIPQEKPYLNITKPLPDSIYTKDPSLPEDLQAIKFTYTTNMLHDEHKRLLNDKQTSEVRKPLNGKYHLILQLFFQWVLLGEKTVQFQVQ
jgi:penicillin-binding protein 1C